MKVGRKRFRKRHKLKAQGEVPRRHGAEPFDVWKIHGVVFRKPNDNHLVQRVYPQDKPAPKDINLRPDLPDRVLPGGPKFKSGYGVMVNRIITGKSSFKASISGERSGPVLQFSKEVVDKINFEKADSLDTLLKEFGAEL